MKHLSPGRKSHHEADDAVSEIYERFYEGKPKQIESLARELLNAEVASQIYELREKAGLTQLELAKLIGTTASTISRLEDSDYGSHSLAMLHRIATAVNKRVVVKFVDIKTAVKPTRKKKRVNQPVTARA